MGTHNGHIVPSIKSVSLKKRKRKSMSGNKETPKISKKKRGKSNIFVEKKKILPSGPKGRDGSAFCIQETIMNEINVCYASRTTPIMNAKVKSVRILSDLRVKLIASISKTVPGNFY